jgi:hypothetical protein
VDLDSELDTKLDTDSIADIELGELPISPVLYCAFCRWGDKEVGSRKWKYLFSHPNSLGRHVRVQHLRNQTVHRGFDCPYRECSAFLGNVEHFLNHTERQYGLRL